MDFYANEGKSVTIQANGKTYARHAITTHFVQVGENYIDLLERYVIPVYQPGDILSASEKVIALCQGRVVTEEQVKTRLLGQASFTLCPSDGSWAQDGPAC